jgi:TetR/AcrR family transcriptional regulator, transcriptional repressor for nem operon
MGRKPNQEARDKILQSAYELIFKFGFKGVSMDDIARAAGIKKANLFHYFPTKEVLGLAVFQYATRCTGVCREAPVTSDPLESVKEMFDRAAVQMRDNCCSGGCIVGNMAQELSDYNENLRKSVAAYIEQWRQRLASFLEDHRANGFFRPDFPAQEAAQSLLALFEGAMLVAKASRSLDPIENAKQMALTYLRTHRR